MLDVPLTDGQGLMNAYQSQPTLGPDGWYHLYWVWRDTPDCSTNHDLSYMKSLILSIGTTLLMNQLVFLLLSIKDH